MYMSNKLLNSIAQQLILQKVFVFSVPNDS